MDSHIGSKSCPIVLFDDEPIESPPIVAAGSQNEPIVLTSDDENEQEVINEQLLPPAESHDDNKVNSERQCIGETSGYFFQGTGVAYDIMLSMGYLPGQGLGPYMNGNIAPVPVSLRKRKRGLGFEGPSPPPSPRPHSASPSNPITSDDLCTTHAAPSIKKSKSALHHEPNLPRASSSKPERSRNTSTIPTLSESTMPAATHNVRDPNRDLNFESYVSTLSGLAMAAMPAAMQVAAVADPLTAFRLAQSYFSPPFTIPSSLLPNMPSFGVEQSLPTMGAGSAAMMSSNGFLPLLQPNSQPTSPILETGPAFNSMVSKDIHMADTPPPTPINPRACIGWIVQPNFPTRGMFRIIPNSTSQMYWGDMHVPQEECCLVMEELPNVHRNVAFVRSWSDQFDPKPAFGVVDVVNGKSLIEFASHAAARAAYRSPRLQGPKYEKAHHVRVFWYKSVDDTARPVTSFNLSSPTANQVQQPKKSLKKKQQGREKILEVPPKATDVVVSSLSSISPHSEKRKQLPSSVIIQSPAAVSQQSSTPKNVDLSSGPAISARTNLTIAPVLRSVSPVNSSTLEHKSASVDRIQEVDLPPGGSSVSSSSEIALKRPNSYKSPESQDHLRPAIEGTKEEANIAGGSSRATGFVRPPNSHKFSYAVKPDDSLSARSNKPPPTPVNGPPLSSLSSSSSNSVPQFESLVEQHLRLQLQAKKQRAIIELALRPTIANPISLADGNADGHSKPRVVVKDEIISLHTPPEPEPASSKSHRPFPCSSDAKNNESLRDDRKPQQIVASSLDNLSTNNQFYHPSPCCNDSKNDDSATADRDAQQAPSLDNLATSFIAETLHSAREQASVPMVVEATMRADGDLVNTAPRPVSSNSTAELAEKQRILAQQIAESKSLMNQYQTARTKGEKDKIMQLWKEQNRLMEMSKLTSERQVIGSVASAAKFCWPQSVNSGVLVVSDDDDDDGDMDET